MKLNETKKTIFRSIFMILLSLVVLFALNLNIVTAQSAQPDNKQIENAANDDGCLNKDKKPYCISKDNLQRYSQFRIYSPMQLNQVRPMKFDNSFVKMPTNQNTDFFYIKTIIPIDRNRNPFAGLQYSNNRRNWIITDGLRIPRSECKEDKTPF